MKKQSLVSQKMVNGKLTTYFDIGVFEEVLGRGADALNDALKILETVQTPEARAWVKKYKNFAK